MPQPDPAQIQALLAEDKLSAAGEVAALLLVPRALRQELLAWQGRLAYLQASADRGELTREEATVERNRLRRALIGWLERACPGTT